VVHVFTGQVPSPYNSVTALIITECTISTMENQLLTSSFLDHCQIHEGRGIDPFMSAVWCRYLCHPALHSQFTCLFEIEMNRIFIVLEALLHVSAVVHCVFVLCQMIHVKCQPTVNWCRMLHLPLHKYRKL